MTYQILHCTLEGDVTTEAPNEADKGVTHSNGGDLKDQSKDNEGNGAEQRKPRAKSVTLVERTINRNSGIKFCASFI